MDVLSFDANKVLFLKNPTRLVRKFTSEKEYFQLNQVIEFLAENNLFIDLHEFKIETPSIISWNGRILDLEYVEGLNLEHALREVNNPNRNFYLKLLKCFIKLLKSHGFLWGDFAPRNMILNKEKKILYIMDFERELEFVHPVSAVQFNRYLRNYSREELACFLFPEELILLLQDFLISENNALVHIDTIVSRRKKRLLEFLFGAKKEYSLYELQDVEDLLVELATPVKVLANVLFPMDILDKKPFDYDEYIIRVKQLKGENGERKYAILKSF